MTGALLGAEDQQKRNTDMVLAFVELMFRGNKQTVVEMKGVWGCFSWTVSEGFLKVTFKLGPEWQK